jgi:small-conductance mechanosensitive channel
MGLRWMIALGLWCLLIPTAGAQLPVTTPPSLPPLRLSTQELASGAANSEALTSLFHREPWSFNLDTLMAVVGDLHRLPAVAAEMLVQLQLSEQTPNLYLLLGVLGMGAILLVLMLFWLDHAFEKMPGWLAHLLPRWESQLRRPLPQVALRALSRSGAILLLIFIAHIVWGGMPDSLFIPALIHILWAFLGYRAGHTILYELLSARRADFFPDPEDAANARSIYLSLHAFLLFSTLFFSGVFGLQGIGYRPDFIGFLFFLFACALLIFSIFLAFRKKDIFSLFPPLEEPVYQSFLSLFKRFYSGVMGFTLTLGLLSLIGYHRLAYTLFMRSWALVGVILGVALLDRGLKQLLQHFLKPAPGERIHLQVLTLIRVCEVLLLARALLGLLGIYEPLLDVLGHPILTFGTSAMSVLSLVSGGVTFTLFLLAARVLECFYEERVYPQMQWDTSVQQIVSMSTFYLLMAFGALFGLAISGLDLSIFTIFAGALGIGIGFGLQGIARNFAGGMVLIFSGLVKKGDYITVGEHSGYVHQVNWKKVHLQTIDAVDLIVPATHLLESPIVNWTHSGPHVRVHVPVRVAFESNLEQVEAVLLEAAGSHSAVRAEPTPQIWLKQFGESALELELLVWIDYERITTPDLIGQLNFTIWKLFQRHGIRIPFPQQDVHLHSLPVAPEDVHPAN